MEAPILIQSKKLWQLSSGTSWIANGRGEFLVVVDNEDRENEGDLIIAGEDLTPERAAFMIRYTRYSLLRRFIQWTHMCPNNSSNLGQARPSANGRKQPRHI